MPSPPRARRRRSYNSPVCFADDSGIDAPARNTDVLIKRIYEARSRSDGFRVLVDRIWPRGMTKQRAALDTWARELAPSPALRKWFGHDPKRWKQFQRRYRAELREHEADLIALRTRASKRRVTLLYAAKDEQFNHAVVLRQAIEGPD